MKTVQEFLAANPAYTGRGFQGFADTYLHVADPCAGDATVVSDNVSTLTASGARGWGVEEGVSVWVGGMG